MCRGQAIDCTSSSEPGAAATRTRSGRGCEDDERLIGKDEPLAGLLLRPGQTAPHTGPAADHVARPTPDLLGHPVRNLRNRVQLQVQVLAPRARLAAVALDCLDIAL